MESGMDFDREALEYQARTTALINAVVAKDKKEREATNRKAAEEKRKEAAAKRQAGAPAAKRQAGVKFKCAHGRQRSQCKDCGGSGICEHGRKDCRRASSQFQKTAAAARAVVEAT